MKTKPETKSSPSAKLEKPPAIKAPPQLEGPADSWDKAKLAQMFLDVAGVMFVGIGADQNVRIINRKGLEILGCQNPEEVIGRNWFDNFIPPSRSGQIKEVFASLMIGEAQPVAYYENPVVARDGKARMIAWHNALVLDDSGNILGTLSSGEDITERKQAESDLIGSEQRLAILSSLVSYR